MVMARIRVSARAACLLAPILLTPSVGLAAWPFDPAVNVPLCTATGSQEMPVAVSDGAGGLVVAWSDTRSGNYDIYAQRVSLAGVPLWADGGVALSTAPLDQSTPAIASDGAGGAIVTWHDHRSSYDIYAQRINSAGVTLWGANGIAVNASGGDQVNPSIVADGAGGAIVTWYDFRGGVNPAIYAERVNASGALQWIYDGVPVCTTANDKGFPKIATDGAGGAIITWSDLRGATNYDLYAQRLNAAGSPLWAANGVVISAASGEQIYPAIIPDGAGGAIVTWQDRRAGPSYDIYAQRVNASGVAQWTANGVALCTAANDQLSPNLALDAAAGAVVTWQDFRGGGWDIYAQRINAAGVVQWTANGVAICAAANDQTAPTIMTDAAGSATIAWQDRRSGTSYDIYAQRVLSAGALLWGLDGVPVSTATGDQTAPAIVAVTTGATSNVIVCWQDARNGAGTDIYAQRIEWSGMLGMTEPSIVTIRDVPNDQGGKVSIRWGASNRDDGGTSVDVYRIWRQVPIGGLTIGLRRSAVPFGATDAGPAPRPGAVRSSIEGSQVYYWEFVGSQPAAGFSGYSFTAATLSDSIAGSNPYTLFMVEVKNSATTDHWLSAPDSGYSVDNLAPATPAVFQGSYQAGAVHLSWKPNQETDLAGYRLYRGSSPAFVPDPGNRIAAPTDTGYVGQPGAPYYYKLSAIDIHGNESGYALVLPSGSVDVTQALPAEVSLGPPTPNPVRTGTWLRLALPREERVSLVVFDQQGRRMREILTGPVAAGEHTVPWDGRDEAGRMVPSGVYFVRLETHALTLVRRLVVIR